MSIINTQGKNRTVLIVPEIPFNAGWWNLTSVLDGEGQQKATRLCLAERRGTRLFEKGDNIY